MKAKTFKDWLVESREFRGEVGQNITLLVARAQNLDELQEVKPKIYEALANWGVTAQVIRIHIRELTNEAMVWFTWDSVEEWGKTAFVDQSEKYIDWIQLRDMWKSIGLERSFSEEGRPALELLLNYYQDAPAELLIGLNHWALDNGYPQLAESIKDLENWPEDITDWALGDW